MASLYSNENFPRRVVAELRRLGNGVLTPYEAGWGNQKFLDDRVLAFATGQQRVVTTLHRLDYIRLHRDTQGAHAGIIVCARDDAAPATFAHRIQSALSTHGNPTGQLIRSGGVNSCTLHLRNMQDPSEKGKESCFPGKVTSDPFTGPHSAFDKLPQAFTVSRARLNHPHLSPNSHLPWQ